MPQLATERGSDVVVFVTDVDRGEGTRTARQARRLIEEMRAAVARGAKRARSDVVVVVGTPCRTIEAWALGDRDAVRVVAQRKDPVRLPAEPESLWGDSHEPHSNHPKHVLHRQFRARPGRAQYAAIAERADLDTVRAACPLSFAPFAAAVAEVLS